MKKRLLALLMTIALGATTVLATGCGAEEESAKGEAAAEETAAAGGGELNIFVWTEYVPDSVIEKFEKETGIKVNMSTYSSNEDMLSKVKSESAGA